jgi:hypothetical protein
MTTIPMKMMVTGVGADTEVQVYAY